MAPYPIVGQKKYFHVKGRPSFDVHFSRLKTKAVSGGRDEGNTLLLLLNVMRLSGLTFRDGFHPGWSILGFIFKQNQQGCVWEMFCNVLISEDDE